MTDGAAMDPPVEGRPASLIFRCISRGARTPMVQPLFADRAAVQLPPRRRARRPRLTRRASRTRAARRTGSTSSLRSRRRPRSSASRPRSRPDVCLIDRDMPEAAGATWETRTRLPQTKLVLIGDGSSDEELFAALRTGVEGFLFKEMNIERLPAGADRRLPRPCRTSAKPRRPRHDGDARVGPHLASGRPAQGSGRPADDA